MADVALTEVGSETASASDREGTVAPVIAEIAAGLKARSLTKVEIFGNHEQTDLGLQLAAILQDSTVDPTVIQQIGLSEVDIGPEGIVALEPALRIATAITTLELRSAKIGDAGAVMVASALRGASGLLYLSLRNNGIGDVGASAIADSLNCWQSIVGVTLSANSVGVAGAQALGDAVSGHPSIDTLSLRSNPLKDDGMAALCIGLKKNTSLKQLFLGGCEITASRGFSAIQEMEHKSVSGLYLGKTQIHQEEAHNVGIILRDAMATVISLDSCALGPTGAASVAESLKVNSVLSVLALNDNAILDKGAVAIAECLRQNTGLSSIDLSQNRIGDAGAAAIGAALEHNATLRQLILTTNEIGSVGSNAFIQHLQDRRTLFQLSIANNPIGETDRKSLRELLHQSTQSAVLVDIADEPRDSGDEKLATTISAAIQGARENTVTTVCIQEPNLTYNDWKALTQALEINTSVTSFRFIRYDTAMRVSNIYEMLAAVVKRSTTLKRFDLQTLPQAGQFPGPQNFWVTQAQSFFGTSPASIMESMRYNSTLETLVLNKCSIASMEATLLAELIQQNPTTSLRVLELMNNSHMGDESAVALAEMLQTNTSLEEIALCATSIGDPGAIALGAALEINQTLTTLRLRNNEIGAEGAEALARALVANQAIKVLHLDANRIGDRGASTIGNVLQSGGGRGLFELALGSNDIGDLGCTTIASALRTSSSLQTLILVGNSITASGASAVFSSLPHSACRLKTLALARNPVATIGVEFLNSRAINSVSLSFTDLIWPPPSVSSRATPDDRSSVNGFLSSVAASSSLLVRSRLMLVGHGGAGKTTLKTALLMSSDSASIAKFRASILEIIQTKWTEADLECWVDSDLTERAGFFADSCPGAAGITGARWLEYSQSDLISVFGVSETETARRVVQKMAQVLSFLQPDRASTIATPSPTSAGNTGWGWIAGVVAKALEESAPHFGDLVGVDNPQTAESDACGLAEVQQQQYNALLNLPHVWTEGIELERWDDAGYTVWDLPGQMELYPAHRMFSASSTAVYVLVVNGSNGYDACTARLSRWLRSLRSGFRHSFEEIKVPVRIVLSHTDVLTGLERTSLMREVLDVAGQRFGNVFDFGTTCFATLYSEEGGGDPSTGVDALRKELVRLQCVGVERHPLPAPYQRVCDDVVSMVRTNELSRWPIVATDTLPTYDQPVEDVVGCLEDLGFVRRVGSRLILEPVTWLSRLMAAFLHPFHGVGCAISKSGVALTLSEHVNAVTLTSVAASRIVNQRGRIVHAENEGEVLEMLSNFDVCFELTKDRFVFPMLLPPVNANQPWLGSSFGRQIKSTPCASIRYCCANGDDSIPPTLAALLMEAFLSIDDCQPMYLGRCTLVAYSAKRTCYIGVHLSADDATLDLFAAGDEQLQHLGLLALNLAVLLTQHYPRLRLERHNLWMSGTREDPIPRIATVAIDHVLLGPCLAEPTGIIAVDDTKLVIAAREVPAWLWESLGKSILRLQAEISATSLAEHEDKRGETSNEALALSGWETSPVRRVLRQFCRPLSLWIDAYSPDCVVAEQADKMLPLRGRRLLVDVLCVRESDMEDTQYKSDHRSNADAHSGNVPAHMCGISFDVLKLVYDQAAALAGDDFDSWTMRDINRAIVKPLCSQHGTSLALVHSPDGLAAEVFVSHAWGESFKHFSDCIFQTYRTSVRKPTLWICTFALLQSDDPAVVAQQIGAVDAPLNDAPFARALRHARELLVVRNSTVDIYSRLWCVCEVYFAHTYGLAPEHTKVVGSDSFAGVITSCLDAKCRDRGDRVRILHALIGGSAANAELVERIDQLIVQFRRFAGEALP